MGVGGGGAVVFSFRLASFQPNLQLLPPTWRLQHCRSKRDLMQVIFIFIYKERNSVWGDFLSRKIIIPGVENGLSPAAVTGFKPVNL